MAKPELAPALDPWAEAPDPRERRAWRGRGARAWFALMALALAFGLIADPAFSLPLACLLCGWEDARAARWLKRSDPVRARGRACSRFYLACGLWRVILMASFLMMLTIMLQAVIEGKMEKGSSVEVPSPGFVGSGITAMIGFPIASAASIVASLSAFRNRVRVWVGPEAHWALADQVWPPQLARRRGKSTNRAKLILLAALIFGSLFVLPVVAIPLSLLVPLQARSMGVGVVITMLLLIGVPALILLLLDRLTARMIAPTPSACWSIDVNADRRTA